MSLSRAALVPRRLWLDGQGSPRQAHSRVSLSRAALPRRRPEEAQSPPGRQTRIKGSGAPTAAERGAPSEASGMLFVTARKPASGLLSCMHHIHDQLGHGAHACWHDRLSSQGNPPELPDSPDFQLEFCTAAREPFFTFREK